MFKSIEFTAEECAEIVEKAKSLTEHGYFTGINFIQAEDPLPLESILVHFLHGSHIHVDYVINQISNHATKIPRFTFYAMNPIYFDKPTFEEDYKGASFFDEKFNILSTKEAKAKRIGITVANPELDLLIPLNKTNLESTIRSLREADDEGPQPWVDPVIIIRTGSELPTLPNFANLKTYINIQRNREEFYTVTTDKRRTYALRKYLKKLCEKVQRIGQLDENSIAFGISQINNEFLEYMEKQIKPLVPLE